MDEQILTEAEYKEAKSQFGNKFTASIGAEAIQELLKLVDLDQESAVLKEELKGSSGQKNFDLPDASKRLKRLEIPITVRNG